MKPRVDSTVRAFDPRTLGVVKTGRVLSVGRKYARIDFGLTGVARVAFRDILEDVLLTALVAVAALVLLVSLGAGPYFFGR